MNNDYVYVLSRGERDEGTDDEGVFATFPGAYAHAMKRFPDYAGVPIEADERAGTWTVPLPDTRDFLLIQRWKVQQR